jgi:hypothetical protein
MTLEGYSELTAKSVAETGYDFFRPSACISSSDANEMCVLDIELKEEGEKTEALAWGASLLKEGSTLFIAYRSGNRVVTVSEVREKEVVAKMTINVRAHDET